MAVRVNKALMHEIEGSRDSPLVLSVQSHVIHGYVGNKVAALVLQLLGVHVDFINSVQYISQFNHNGTKTTAEDLKNYFHHLKDSNINKYSHILTGFVGSVEYLREIIRAVKDLKDKAREDGRDNPIWVCDPVLGDRGEIYTAKGLLEVFRDEAFAVADVITPNHFELGWLCGKDAETAYKTEADVFESCEELHAKGVGMVVVTSVPLTPGKLTMVVSASTVNEADLTFAAQPASEEAKKTRKRFMIEFDDKSIQLYGTGDMIASCILASLADKPATFYADPAAACERALYVVQQAIATTLSSAPEGATPVELDVVGSRREIMQAFDDSAKQRMGSFEVRDVSL